MRISNISGHGREANKRICGKGDILQRETVTPIVPYYHQDEATYKKFVEHAQPLHWIFTYMDERNMRLASRRYGLTYIQYRVLDVDDLDFCRDVASAIARLHYLSEI